MGRFRGMVSVRR